MRQTGNIPIKNIYYMLAYAFHTLNRSDLVNIETEKFDNIHNLFAAILCNGIGLQLKQGLYREYIDKTEDLATLHGKIDIAGSIRNKIAHRQLLTCEYDELSENNLLNQILKTTVTLLLRCNDVESVWKNKLKKEMMFFSEVDLIDSPAKIPWSNVRFHRNNQTYRILVSLCQLVIEGMLLTDKVGENRLASFVDDQQMSRLYEKFVLEYYRREWPGLNAAASQIPWALDDGIGTMLPTMQSDITLTNKAENNVLIIDTKYYGHTTQSQYNSHKVHSNNLYQIFTYVKNKAAQLAKENEQSADNAELRPTNVSGMLLYARTTEAIQPNESYQLSGNRIDVRTLDLNCDFPVIKSQLNRIVQDFFGESAS